MSGCKRLSIAGKRAEIRALALWMRSSGGLGSSGGLSPLPVTVKGAMLMALRQDCRGFSADKASKSAVRHRVASLSRLDLSPVAQVYDIDAGATLRARHGRAAAAEGTPT